MSSGPSRGRRSWLWGVAILLLAVAAGFGGWGWLKRSKPPDSVAVLQANSRGIGYMEQFAYEKAAAAFEEVIQLDPDWLPGRINLGIALLNQAGDSGPDQSTKLFDRAVQILEKVLRDNPDKEPEILYAHYCLGIILDDRGKFTEAAPHFRFVTQKDPTDPYAWFYFGKQLVEDDDEATKCFQRAVDSNPYLNPAVYSLAQKLQLTDAAKASALRDVTEQLKTAKWEDPNPDYNRRYTEVGRYAQVIGMPDTRWATATGPLPLFARQDQLQVKLAAGARWATADDLRQGLYGELRTRLRERFGGVMVLLDYNGDGKPDVFLLAAVVEGGRVRNLLLRNDGNNVFTDVTVEAGLGGERPSVGCCVADFNNDGHPDLFITGIGEQHLFRNTGKGGFEDVTKEAHLDALNTVCLGAAFVDLDQDADLDLIVTQYASTPENALAALKGEAPARGAGLAVYLNIGEAPAANPSVDPPPLKPNFKRLDKPGDVFGPTENTVSLAVTDLDGDRDLDWLVVSDRAVPTGILNDRLLRFHRAAFPESLAAAGLWNGCLVLDVNHDERSDLFLISPDRRPVLLLSRLVRGPAGLDQLFQAGATDSPPLLMAHAIDIDLDGWTDVVGLSNQRKPVLLHNDGQRLVHARQAFGLDENWPRDLVGLAVGDFNGDCFPDLLVWSESTGLQLHISQKNGHHALKLKLTGHNHVSSEGGMVMRCNADGFGTWVVAQASNHRTGAEYTTLSAGLGQSRQPLFLGMAKHTEPDVVRLRWPDFCTQAEFNVPTCQIWPLEESNRKRTSCPVLFVWDGERFTFVTDFLGAGTLGEILPGGAYNTPRPEESVKIEASQLKPRNGEYILKLAEPMDEVTYLDRLQLVVLDHPADVRVYPDERFVDNGPPASQELLAFREEIYPAKARDHRGRDVTATLRRWDRDTVNGFARRAWLGFAEEHWVELDFGDRLARFGPKDRLVLCLAGWTDYPEPQSIWAADQAGFAVQAPVLERLDADGRWQSLGEAGFPAGLPRMMTLDVTGKLAGPRCVVRLRTNMQVYWDQIFVAPLLERVAVGADFKSGAARATCLDVSKAELSVRGLMQEHSPDGRQPTVYDYDRLDAVPASRLSGRWTRLGDVTELLRDRDDRFAIFGPGDEVTVRFDARQLPELPAGWTRSFVLRTWGYCKDCAPFTATGDTIEPLPFRAMSGYPYGPHENYPRDALHEDYRRRYNTRQVGPCDSYAVGRAFLPGRTARAEMPVPHSERQSS